MFPYQIPLTRGASLPDNGKKRVLMTHKYRGSIVVLSISKSVEPNEEQKETTTVFSKVFSASTEIIGNR